MSFLLASAPALSAAADLRNEVVLCDKSMIILFPEGPESRRSSRLWLLAYPKGLSLLGLPLAS
jgi:hypothetical protein